MIDLDELLFDLAERLADNDSPENEISKIDEITRRLLDISEDERNDIVRCALASDHYREALFAVLATSASQERSALVRKTNISGERVDSKGIQFLCSGVIESSSRWISLVGSAGSGKSRAAKLAALQLMESFDEVWWIDRSRRLDQAILRQISSEPSLWLSGSAAEEIANRSMLLVLDNFDPQLAVQGYGLLSRCPNLRILSVTPLALGLEGEKVVEIRDIVSLNREDAFETLSQMLTKVAGSNPFTPRLSDSIRLISRRLVGAPLAMILAAGCLATAPPATVVSAVESTPVIKQDSSLTLRALIQLSVSSLDESAVQSLRALTLFQSPFSRNRAEALLGDASVVLTRLEQLGLIEATPNDYRLPRSVSEYLQGQTVLPEYRQKYELVMANVAEEMALTFELGDWASGVAMLVDNLDDFRHASHLASQDGAADRVKVFCQTLARQYFEAILMDDFEDLIASANSINQLRDDVELQIRLLGLVGANCSRKNDQKGCGAAWTRRLELCRSIGDRELEADTLCDLAALAREEDEFDKAFAFADEAEVVIRELGSVELEATIEVIRARCYQQTGQTEKAKDALARTEALLDKCQDKDLNLFVYQNIGIYYEEYGVPERGKSIVIRLLQESSSGHRAVHIGWSMSQVAHLSELNNDLETSAMCLAGAKLVFERYASKYLHRANERIKNFLSRHPEMKSSVDIHLAGSWQAHVAEILQKES